MSCDITPPHGGRSFLKPRKARKLPTGSHTSTHLIFDSNFSQGKTTKQHLPCFYPSNIGCNSTEEIAPLVFFCMQNSSISDLAMQRPSNFARMWIHSRPSTLSDWGQQAKRLDRSLGAYTPAPSTPSSMGALVQHPDSLPSRLGWIGCLFSGETSSLDAFSSYSRQRGCPAVPCRTTGILEAATPRSSRTRGAFPSGNHHFQQVESDLSRDGLNPSRIPL